MNTIAMEDIKMIMVVGLFLTGFLTFWIGVAVLIYRTGGHDQRTIATQATRLAQKGLAEEIAGLVGNASSLLTALNELMRTAAGIGIFLILIGLSLIGLSIWLVLQIP